MTQSTDEKREGGQEEYLASYDISAYDRPSVTADAVISDPAGRILLVKRKNHPCDAAMSSYPYPLQIYR